MYKNVVYLYIITIIIQYLCMYVCTVRVYLFVYAHV